MKEFYKVLEDWDGGKFIGLTLDWDYENGEVHVLMPGYIEKALKSFQHPPQTRTKILPTHIFSKHGISTQYVEDPSDSPLSAKKRRNLSQK